MWLEKPVDVNDENEIRQKMYNAKVVLDGYANVYEYAPNNTLYDLFCHLRQKQQKTIEDFGQKMVLIMKI